jgi:isobutyryl-CoA mutase
MRLRQVVVTNGHLFAELMKTVKYCSLGQITNALFEVGGRCRRNMQFCLSLASYLNFKY